MPKNTNMNLKQELGACREKYWNELTQEEKIERLAEELLHAIYVNRRLSDDIAELMEHEHSQTGELVRKIHRGEPTFRGYGMPDNYLELRLRGERK